MTNKVELDNVEVNLNIPEELHAPDNSFQTVGTETDKLQAPDKHVKYYKNESKDNPLSSANSETDPNSPRNSGFEEENETSKMESVETETEKQPLAFGERAILVFAQIVILVICLLLNRFVKKILIKNTAKLTK